MFIHPARTDRMPRPGDVYYLPLQEGERIDPHKGDRPFVVLTHSDETEDSVTVAYGSTKGTEAAWGAAHVLVNPFATRGTGLSAPTYVYTSRLATYLLEDLGQPQGQIVDAMPSVQESLRTATGLGTGVTRDANVNGSNRRGRVVRLTKVASDRTGYEFAIVVTEPNYSRVNRQQTIIPILDFDSETVANDVIVLNPHWFRSARRGPLVLAAPLVTTLFAPAWFERYTATVLPAETMDRIDHALMLHFGL